MLFALCVNFVPTESESEIMFVFHHMNHLALL